MIADERAALVDETLRAAGWVRAFDGYAEAGIEVTGFGEAALQFPNEEKETLLRLEYHVKGPDGLSEVHLHVSDESDAGGDFVLRDRGNLRDVLAAIVRVQRELTVDTVHDLLPAIADLCAEAYLVQDQRLRSLKTLFAARPDFERGVDLANDGKDAEAIAAFERAIAIDPEHAAALQYAVQLCRTGGDFAKMRDLAARWCKASPMDPEAWLHLSVALQNLRDFDGALEVIDAAIAIDDSEGTLHYQRACVLALSGRADDCIAAIRTAVALDPALASDIAEDEDFASVRESDAFRVALDAV